MIPLPEPHHIKRTDFIPDGRQPSQPELNETEVWIWECTIKTISPGQLPTHKFCFYHVIFWKIWHFLRASDDFLLHLKARAFTKDMILMI